MLSTFVAVHGSGIFKKIHVFTFPTVRNSYGLVSLCAKHLSVWLVSIRPSIRFYEMLTYSPTIGLFCVRLILMKMFYP